MTRNLKRPILLVGVLLALLGLMAQAASAHVPARFTSEQNVTTIRGVHDAGTSNTTFTVTGNNATCEIEEFHGTAVGTSLESITINPTYTECTVWGFIGGKVTGFGHYPASEGAGPYCDYELKANGGAGLVCPAGKDVTYDAGPCISHVPAQNIAGTITYTTGTREGKHDLTLDINLSGITTNHTDGFACLFFSGGHSATATLVGKWTFWGQNPDTGAAVGITWDATTA
jgi:hypothetical protein